MGDDVGLGELDHAVRGELLVPDRAGYEAARRVFNAMIDHRPLAMCAV